MRIRFLLLSLITLGVLSAARPASADILYAIGNGGGSLVRIDSSNPSVTSAVTLSGDDSFLDGIDYRPSTGQLYGYRSLDHSFYTVDTTTGALTSAPSPSSEVTNTFFLGIDWNPTIDRLRIVTDSAQNIVYNPSTGGTTAATDLFYGSGDPNAGTGALVIDNAYTNSFSGATTTTQYVLDYGLNALATLNNNTGILSTVGVVTLNGSPLDFDEFTTGFDILSAPAGSNIAYALLSSNGVQGLYTLDLTTGAATSLGDLDQQFGPIYGLTAQLLPVPEPGSIAMVSIGFGLFGIAVKHRRKRVQ